MTPCVMRVFLHFFVEFFPRHEGFPTFLCHEGFPRHEGFPTFLCHEDFSRHEEI